MDKFSKIWEKINEIDDRLKKIEVERNSSNVDPNEKLAKNDKSSLDNKIKQKIHEIGIQHLILFILKLKSKQSKNDIIKKLQEWQKPIGIWFKGSNFKNRLLKKSYVIVDGKNKEGEELYSLGMRGVRAVKDLMKKYQIS